MKRMLYFTKMNFGIDVNYGFKKKVMAQAAAFSAAGIATDVLFVENNDIVLENSDNRREFHFDNPRQRSIFQFIFSPQRLQIERYDYVYIRHFLTNPLLLIFLRKCKEINPNLKIVMEIPTFPYQYEHTSFKKKLAFTLDKWCTMRFKEYIDRIVTFSDADHIFDIETIKTHNGIDVNEVIPMIETKDVAQINLIGLANVQPWHGFDRVVRGMANYKGDVNIQFNIVGEGSELAHLQALTSSLKLEDNVHFHGHKTGTALEEIFSTQHIGIANLAFHRLNVSNGETSALKSREYALRGLPFLIGYNDRDFPTDFPYKFQIESSENDVDIQALISEYVAMRTKYTNFASELQVFAKTNLGWAKKLEKVVEYLLV